MKKLFNLGVGYAALALAMSDESNTGGGTGTDLADTAGDEVGQVDRTFTTDGDEILFEDDDLTNRPADEPKVSFKHRSTASFKVGKFQFKNFVMTIPQSEEEAFLLCWRGLQGPDKTNIVRLRNVQNEEAIKPSRVVRNAPLASNQIPNATKNVGAQSVSEQTPTPPSQAPQRTFQIPGRTT